MKKFTYKFNTSEQKIFFTSDTHWYHENIIKFCNRPFYDVYDMNERLIQNWNSVVGENDIVFHLGDIFFCGSKEAEEILSRLNGKIYLILGNHDYKNLNEGYMNKFELVTPKMNIIVDDQKILLNHEPLLAFSGAYRGLNATWQLFGHVHSLPKNEGTGLDIQRLINLFPSQYDVGVDHNNFTPISFEEVKEIIKEQELSQNLWRN